MTAGASWEEVVSRLEQAVQRLLAPAPEALEEAAGELERAESGLRELLRVSGAARAGPPGLGPQRLQQLHRQARLAAALLENAGALRLGWARLLSVMIAGYTPQGEPAPLQAPASVIVEG